MDLSPDVEMRRIPDLVQEFLENVLFDEEPLYVSDEATISDVSLANPDELAKRCSEYYGISVSADDLKQPLWRLIRELSDRRKDQSGQDRIDVSSELHTPYSIHSNAFMNPACPVEMAVS